MITYLTGDATEPDTNDKAVIAHVCNDVGKYGAGFAAAVAQRYPRARERYLESPHPLGTIQWVGVGHDWRRDTSWDARWVVNMTAQRDVRSAGNAMPLQLDALGLCLRDLHAGLATMAPPVSVHMPRIGCGLAGGKWADVEPLILQYLDDTAVYVYDFEAMVGARR